MARIEKAPAANVVSLFPFLSILACVIGALTLIISSLSLSQVSEGRQDKDIARAEDYVTLQKSLVAKQENLRDLERQSKLKNEHLLELRQLEAEEKKLVAELKGLEKSQDKRLALDEESDALQLELDNVVAGRKKVEEQVADSLKQLALLKKDSASDARVQILPSRGTSRIAPAFVEIAKAGMVLHTRSRSIEVERGKMGTDVNLRKLVDATQRAARGTIVLLLRPDGYPTYSTFRSVARKEGWAYAKLPLLSEGPVDLKLFNIQR
ncbi:MAG: hypothetical protein GY899_19215 [Verrucomicrobiaceae bacterium]|nr:hypothetical protein [Verrucomicrobiaceae bacterium]